MRRGLDTHEPHGTGELHGTGEPDHASAPIGRSRRLSRFLGAGAAAALVLGLGVTPALGEDTIGTEPHRPGYHYTPEKNWINDPNGLVYHDGLYHLYYQYNPQGNSWGNMSWGHATSPDLMNWTEQALAIPQTFNDDGASIEDIFSGSVVVDHGNTSGLGDGDEDPLIAIYTSAYTGAHPEHAGKQAQSLAYSTDGGYTWEKYEGNPVADRDSANFRDPKVFWYEGETEADSHWVMVAVEATDHQVIVSTSKNLIDWEHASSFGPANAVSGIWECPDLFELPVDGDPDDTRWVMVVNLNPGAVAGGSGGQYFVGDFDGTEFTAENVVEDVAAPEGELLWDFEGADGFDGWTVNNQEGAELDGPFGTAPATGAVSGQTEVTGYQGEGFVNSFHGGDAPIGTMESDSFTVDSDYLSFLVGGGNNPYVEGTRPDNDPPEGTLLWNGFEETEATEDQDAQATLEDMGWTGSGDLAAADSPSTSGGEFYIGDKRINTYEGGPKGDDNQGTLTSPEFTIDGDHLSMLVGGGGRDADSEETLEVQLVVDGEVVRTQTGPDDGALNWHAWDLTDLQGRTAQLRVVDEATGGWGHITLDHVVMGDEAALPRGNETTVNLVVDGEVVRSTTGTDSEALDWRSWDVSEYRGQEASVRIVDNGSGGWGHVLVDHIVATDSPTASTLENYHWLDWGMDYYAAVSYSEVPEGKRIMTGWMNNWLYAGDSPVSPWRSAMSLPREVTLVSTEDGIELQQAPVDQAQDALRADDAVVVTDQQIAEGSSPLTGAPLEGSQPRAAGEPVSGDMLRIDLTLDPGSADRAGIVVAADGTGEGTLVGYDASTGRAFVDRTDSGITDFHADFPGQVDVPVTEAADGTVSMSIWLDRSSVEVFTEDGTRTMTELIYPDAGSQQVLTFAEGGDARIVEATVTPVDQTMFVEDDGGEEPTDPTDEPTDPTDEPTDPSDDPTDEPADPSADPSGSNDPSTDPSDGSDPSADPSAEEGGSLPVTGANVLVPVLTAAGLLSAGIVALGVSRLRRR
jgi:levanase